MSSMMEDTTHWIVYWSELNEIDSWADWSAPKRALHFWWCELATSFRLPLPSNVCAVYKHTIYRNIFIQLSKNFAVYLKEREWVRETRREIWNWFRNFIQKYLKEMMMMHCMGKGGKAIYFSSILQAHKNHKNCCQRLYIHVIPSIFGGGRVKSFSQFFCISKLISFDKYMKNSCAFLLELDIKWMFLKKVLFLILQFVKII